MRYVKQRDALERFIPTALLEVLSENNCWVAGGAVTSIFTDKPINDVDVYFRNAAELEIVMNFVKSKPLAMSIICRTNRALTFWCQGVVVQLVFFKYFDTAEGLFNSFDFVACMGAFDVATRSFILHEEFLTDLSSKTLHVNPTTDYPIISLSRLRKYELKGWSVPVFERLKLVLAITTLNIHSWESLRLHLGGMYGLNYEALDSTKAPFSITKAIELLSSPRIFQT